jgi:hypothetical protein
MRIQQAIPAKHKSPAREDLCGTGGRVGVSRADPAAQKTRPPAEYDACAALPCPDIEIGSRRPVNHKVHKGARADVIHFTVGAKKQPRSLRRNETRAVTATKVAQAGDRLSLAI